MAKRSKKKKQSQPVGLGQWSADDARHFPGADEATTVWLRYWLQLREEKAVRPLRDAAETLREAAWCARDYAFEAAASSLLPEERRAQVLGPHVKQLESASRRVTTVLRSSGVLVVDAILQQALEHYVIPSSIGEGWTDYTGISAWGVGVRRVSMMLEEQARLVEERQREQRQGSSGALPSVAAYALIDAAARRGVGLLQHCRDAIGAGIALVPEAERPEGFDVEQEAVDLCNRLKNSSQRRQSNETS